MAFQSNLVHCVIAVSKDSPHLPQLSSSGLHGFLVDAAREMGAQQLAAGGAMDHIHLLTSIPTTVALASVIEGIKAMSQRWLRETVHGCVGFKWDHGFTTFSVGIPQVRETMAYIDRQLECHRKIGYEQELMLFSEAYGLATPARI